MKNERIDLYIRSVINLLPKKVRDDAAKEIRELISEMLKKRCGDNLPEEKDIRVVLAELGEPI